MDPRRVDSSSKEPHPKAIKSVPSIVRALKPTPSEISVTSTAYSHTDESTFEDAPPVPRIPSVYTRPTRTYRNTAALSSHPPSPPPPRDPAHATSTASSGNSGKPPSSTPPKDDEHRASAISRSLALLEGTHIPDADSAADSSSSSCSSSDGDGQPSDREKGFQKWVAHYHKKQQRREAEKVNPALAVVPPTPTTPTTPVAGVDHGEQDKLKSVDEEQETEDQDDDQNIKTFILPPAIQLYSDTHTYIRPQTPPPAAHKANAITRTKDFIKPVNPIDNPTGYYPYVADPQTFENAGRKLRDLGNKVKGKFASIEAQGPRHPREKVKTQDVSSPRSPRAEFAGGTRPALMSLKEAQKQFHGHPEKNALFVMGSAANKLQAIEGAKSTKKPYHHHTDKKKTRKILDPSRRGTTFGDFMEQVNTSPPASDTEDDDIPEPSPLRQRPDSYQDPRFLSPKRKGKTAAQRKAEYNHLMQQSPPISPLDFNGINRGKYTTGKTGMKVKLKDTPKFEVFQQLIKKERQICRERAYAAF